VAVPVMEGNMEYNIDVNEYNQLLESVRLRYGYDFTEYAESSIKRRIIYFMNRKQVHDLAVLNEMLLKDEGDFEEFIQDLSVTVTEMFRDPDFYKKLREIVLQRLATYPFIKIWIAGCATGQEIYSMAILLKEEGLYDRSIIYATDINQRSLQVARQGVYPLEDMRTYTGNYLKAGGKNNFSDYYIAKYHAALFDESLKQNIVFSSHNLVSDKSFNEFQLVICRNVIMYFNQNLQNKVVDLLHESLCQFGFLALGNKESLLFSDKRNYFSETDRKDKIYMKTK
jgi:chemotaxis protein methyltransferase CheR